MNHLAITSLSETPDSSRNSSIEGFNIAWSIQLCYTLYGILRNHLFHHDRPGMNCQACNSGQSHEEVGRFHRPTCTDPVFQDLQILFRPALGIDLTLRKQVIDLWFWCNRYHLQR